MSYSEPFAALYDTFYADKDTDAEAAFVERHVRAAHAARAATGAPSVLDVACGTGRHASALLARGLEVVGVDLEPAMLTRARARAPNARFALADMTRLERCALAAASAFDGAICLFDSLGYARDNDGVASTLRGMARALVPGGVLIVEVWHAAALYARSEPVRVRRFAGDVVRIAETRVDAARALATTRWTLCAPGLLPGVGHAAAAGAASAGWPSEEHTKRVFGAPELALFLEGAGLEVQSVAGGFAGEAITVDAFHLVAVARRPLGVDGAPVHVERDGRP